MTTVRAVRPSQVHEQEFLLMLAGFQANDPAMRSSTRRQEPEQLCKYCVGVPSRA